MLEISITKHAHGVHVHGHRTHCSDIVTDPSHGFLLFPIISELVLIIVQSLKEVNGFSHFPVMKL
jgi:hypothetical protein